MNNDDDDEKTNQLNLFSQLCLKDPLDTKTTDVENALKKHGIMKLIDSNYLLTELHLLILKYDRIQNILWCLHNLELTDEAKANLPEPEVLYTQKKRNMEAQPIPTYSESYLTLDPFQITVKQLTEKYERNLNSINLGNRKKSTMN